MPPKADDDPSRPLDLDALTGLVGYALRQTQVAVYRTVRAHFAAFDIRPSQFGILTAIGRNPGLRPSEVGAALGVQRTNLVPLLNGLVERGLIARERLQTDRRAHSLRLTEAGEEVLAGLMRAASRHEAEITASLAPGERERLLALLDAVRRGCDETGTA